MSELDSKSAFIFRILAYGSFGVMVLILAYAGASALTENFAQVGYNLVNIEIPPPSISPLYFKPITILYVSSIIFTYVQLERYKFRIARFPRPVLSLAKFISFMFAAVFFYELCYNFVFWGGEIAAGAIRGTLSPDVIAQISNPFPDLTKPWNVVFATKLWSILFIAGLYTFYFLRRLEDIPPQKPAAIAST